MKQLAHDDIPRLSDADIKDAERHPVSLLLDRVRSAQNVGSLLRTSDALGIQEVIMTGFTPDGQHKAVHKSALGAQHFVPWRKESDALEIIHTLRQKGWTIAALEITDEPSAVRTLEMTDFPLLLVVGNEVDGIAPELLDVCDLALELPQFGAKQSLNVSVATGVVCYDLVRHFRSLANLSEFPEHDPRDSPLSTGSPPQS